MPIALKASESPKGKEENENDSEESILMLAAGVALLGVRAFAQEYSRQDFAVQAVGSFVKTTTDDGVQNKVDHSAGVLGTYRFFFNKHHGFEVNYGYTHNTESYSGLASLETRTHEISGAYVIRFPMKRITPFGLAGVSALVFDPHNFTGASSNTNPAFVYGGGADVNLTGHVFLRAQYRGFLYHSPMYSLAELDGYVRTTHRAEPSIGFGYRF